MRSFLPLQFAAASVLGIAALGTFLFPVIAGAADDSTRAAVRGIATEGVEAYAAEDYKLATEKLEMAYSVAKVPSLALWSARALEKNGLLVEAAERYLEATRLASTDGDAAVQERAKADAGSERKALLPRIPQLLITAKVASTERLTIQVNGANYNVALLGAKRPTNPGQVTLVMEQDGKKKEETLTLAEAESRSVELAFTDLSYVAPTTNQAPDDATEATSADQASESGNPMKPAFIWGGFGLAAVGIGTGAVTGILSLGKVSDLKEEKNCSSDGECDVGGEDAQKSAQTLGWISTISFGVGILGAGLGIYGLTLDDSSAAPTAAKRLTWDVQVGSTASRFTLKGNF